MNIPDNTLYSYRPINKNTLYSLLMDEVYVNDPKKFNDPYDSDFSAINNRFEQLCESAKVDYKNRELEKGI